MGISKIQETLHKMKKKNTLLQQENAARVDSYFSVSVMI